MTNLDSVLKSRHYSADKRLYNQGYGIPSDFPGGSDGKESACNVRDLGSVPGLGRSPGEGNGNSLQYSSMDRGTW